MMLNLNTNANYVVFMILLYWLTALAVTVFLLPDISTHFVVAEVVVGVMWSVLFSAVHYVKRSVLLAKEIVNRVGSYVGDEYFQEMTASILKILEPDWVLVGQLITIDDKKYIQTHCVRSTQGLQPNFTYETKHTPCGDVIDALTNKIINNDVTMLYPNDDLLIEMDIKGYAGFPLFNHSAIKTGILVCLWERPVKKKEKATISLMLETFSSRASVELERKLMSNKLEYKSNHDSLTALPNRSYMMEQLSALFDSSSASDPRIGQGADLYLIDLDDFKEVNDTHGHHIGDKLLQEVAARLKSVVRGTDIVSRFGGDEFVVLKRSGECSELFANRIVEQFSYAYTLGQELIISVTGSVGAVSIPTDSTNPGEALRFADFAMYKAKKLGKNKYVRFTKELYEHATEEKEMISDLRIAIENNELEINIQPIIKLSKTPDHFLNGEVLSRWKNKDTLVPPAQFIKLAEEQGLIHYLGKQIFEKTCNYCKRALEETGLRITLSVNCSINQLRDFAFAKFAKDTIEKYNIQPEQILIEITESAIFETDLIEKTMICLTEYGFNIAIDDFGSGYSGLSYIGNIPVSTVKLDRSFIVDINIDKQKQQVVKAIAAMCKAYNYQIVAEGVETQLELDFIKLAGYDYAQGHIYSTPLSQDDYIKYIKDNINEFRKTNLYI